MYLTVDYLTLFKASNIDLLDTVLTPSNSIFVVVKSEDPTHIFRRRNLMRRKILYFYFKKIPFISKWKVLCIHEES